MLDTSVEPERISLEEASVLRDQMQKAASVSPAPGNVVSLKKRYRFRREMSVLSEFMVKNFCAGILIKCRMLCAGTPAANAISLADFTCFLRKLLSRVKATRSQFKHMSAMVIKFLGICGKSEQNYMRFINYDVRKIVVSCLVLSFPQDQDQPFYLVSRATGLGCEQLRHCSDIVGPILKSENLRLQRNTARHQHAGAQTAVDTRSNAFGTFANHYAHEISDHDPFESLLQSADMESYNEMGRKLVEKNFILR